MGGRSYFQLGHELRIDGFTFAFLDGDHDHVTIGEELRLLMPRLARKGLVIVDNVDLDPDTHRVLAQWKHMLLPQAPNDPRVGVGMALVTRS